MENSSCITRINGVVITPLNIIRSSNGAVYHMLKKSDPQFSCFGEIYFSQVFQHAIKGWHRHTKQINHYAVPVGNIKLVLYDDRPNSETNGKIMECIIGETHYQLLTIPIMIWYAFQGLTSPFSLVANCATEEHDENETDRLPINNEQIPYQWELSNEGK